SPRTRLALSSIVAAVIAIAGFAMTPAVAAEPATASAGKAATAGILSDSLKPKVTAHFDRRAVELGIRFSPTASGKVTALQYYQTGRATGVKTATLWASNGKALARQTFK